MFFAFLSVNLLLSNKLDSMRIPKAFSICAISFPQTAMIDFPSSSLMMCLYVKLFFQFLYVSNAYSFCFLVLY
uniref:Uncharacterized protein n=1 Tax=Dulem virus 42 TaxID=3145760 RepID=A0AAU8BA12_9CAUD